jgi:hypothetical protein
MMASLGDYIIIVIAYKLYETLLAKLKIRSLPTVLEKLPYL